jgi:hypothetical protein
MPDLACSATEKKNNNNLYCPVIYLTEDGYLIHNS